jgi:hypothetical protein
LAPRPWDTSPTSGTARRVVVTFYVENGVVKYEGWRNSQVEPWLVEIERFYMNCIGLEVPRLQRCLTYDPKTGVLSWAGNYFESRRGGARTGERVLRSGFKIEGRWVNTIGVIYLLHLGHLPRTVIPFRNGDANDWRWANISPLLPGEPVVFTTEPMRGRRDRMLRARA